jgi:hypothetical protein
VVPGEVYRAEDKELFDRIASAVFASQPSERVCQRLWVLLSDVAERSRRPDMLLLKAIDEVPALQFLIESFADDRTQLARAIGMSLAATTTHVRAHEARRQSLASAG